MTADDRNRESSTKQPIRTVPPDADPAKFPKAFAARIGNREVWIANGGAIDPEHLSAMNLNPESVVSVNRTATRATTDHHPLKDGYINDQQDFAAAVETTRERMQTDGIVIVNCAAGISRSSTVIATAIAAEDELSFEAVVEEIRETRPRARPHPKLQLNAYAYLVNVENRYEGRDKLSELAENVHGRGDDSDIIDDLLD